MHCPLTLPPSLNAGAQSSLHPGLQVKVTLVLVFSATEAKASLKGAVLKDLERVCGDYTPAEAQSMKYTQLALPQWTPQKRSSSSSSILLARFTLSRFHACIIG